MDDSYIISAPGESEITIKRSRFLGAALPVSDEESAVSLITARKKEHFNARHNCFAYILSESGIRRSSDDGEPSQTAGAPILEAMESAGVTDAIVIVTRYFGGTLLGTGGLTRAYREAASLALSNATLSLVKNGYPMTLVCDYSLYGSIEYILKEHDIPITEVSFTSEVSVKCMVPEDKKDFLERTVTERSGGIAKIEWGRLTRYTMADNRVNVI